MFYSVPSDLEELDSRIRMLVHCFGGAGTYTSPQFLDETLSEVSAEVRATVARLTREGRAKDIKAYKKHVLSFGRVLGNRLYNHLFYPWAMSVFPK